MASIFISYRREDSIAYAGRLYDRLHSHFGSKHQVFMDVDTINPGDDFIEKIEQTVASCEVLIAVIGRQWLTAADEEGRARLQNPEDFVHLEIRTALERKVRVIPILVAGARMPRSQDLPATLALLARRQAIEISDHSFHLSVTPLIEILEKTLAAAELSKPPVRDAVVERPGPERRAGETRVNPKDGLTYVWIPPGKFMMGCSPGDGGCSDYEKPAHEVAITKGFWIGQTPVTQEAYQKVMGQNPSHFKGAKLPVENISWDDAQSYCQESGTRLPTEAEWEYAARAGSKQGRYEDVAAVAWYRDNSGGKTHDVAQRAPNPWGLYDTLGNIWEWTEDWYADHPSSSETDPRGPTSGQFRVTRGGSWVNDSALARVSYRNWCIPELRDGAIGFRCVAEFL